MTGVVSHLQGLFRMRLPEWLAPPDHAPVAIGRGFILFVDEGTSGVRGRDSLHNGHCAVQLEWIRRAGGDNA